MLNQQIESMSKEHLYQEDEAKRSFDELKQKLDASEQEKILLEKEVFEAQSEISELRRINGRFTHDSQIIVEKKEERTNELSRYIVKLEGQLEEQEKEALDAVEQWQSACSDLEMKCVNLDLEVKKCRETISTRGWSMEQLRSCNETYCTQIEYLQVSFRRMESSLREKLAITEVENSRLLEAHEIECEKSAENQSLFKAELEAEKEKNRETLNEVKTLTLSIEEIKRASEDTLNQWVGMYIYNMYFCFL